MKLSFAFPKGIIRKKKLFFYFYPLKVLVILFFLPFYSLEQIVNSAGAIVLALKISYA